MLFGIVAAAPAARATLIGQTVTVGLTDGGSLALSDTVVVGAGPELAPGDGSQIGGVLLPNERVDVGAEQVVLTLEEGAPNGTTGYPAGTHYLLSNLVFFDAPTALVGVNVLASNVSNLSPATVSFTSSTVSVALDTLVIGDIPGIDVGTLTLELQFQVVPEPAAAALLATGLATFGCVARRGRRPA
jgi:hypothetical protein